MSTKKQESVAQASRPVGLLGVLGGMGPLATALFYQRVIEATPSRRDQDHLPVVIWADPTVPDRSSALLGEGGTDPTPWLVRGAKVLATLGAQLIAVPCNSAQPFLPEAQVAVDVPLMDIVATTVHSAINLVGDCSDARVAVLSTQGLYRGRLYEDRLAAARINVVEIGDSDRFRVQGLISRIKAGHPDPSSGLLDDIVAGLKAARVDTVILGCTELTTICDAMSQHFVVVDSATMLARAAIVALRGEQPQCTQEQLPTAHPYLRLKFESQDRGRRTTGATPAGIVGPGIRHGDDSPETTRPIGTQH
jgi:aspartate racemase